TLASGCGGSGTLTAQEYPAAAEQLVSAADLGRIDPASPEYTVMAWWRDVQFSDFSGYLSHLTRSVRLRLTAQQLERELPILAGDSDEDREGRVHERRICHAHVQRAARIPRNGRDLRRIRGDAYETTPGRELEGSVDDGPRRRNPDEVGAAVWIEDGGIRIAV